MLTSFPIRLSSYTSLIELCIFFIFHFLKLFCIPFLCFLYLLCHHICLLPLFYIVSCFFFSQISAKVLLCLCALFLTFSPVPYLYSYLPFVSSPLSVYTFLFIPLYQLCLICALICLLMSRLCCAFSQFVSECTVLSVCTFSHFFTYALFEHLFAFFFSRLCRAFF